MAKSTEAVSTPENTNNTPAVDVTANSEKNTEKIKNKYKEFERIYGKNPTEASVLYELQKPSETGEVSDAFKDCKTFDEAMKIIKEGKDPANKDYSAQHEDLYNRLKKNVVSKEIIEEKSKTYDWEKIFGKQPNKAGVLRVLKERSTAYNDVNTFEDAMKILEKRRPPAHKRIMEHMEVGDHPLQYADEATIDKELAERELSPADLERKKNEEIEAKKEELLKPEPTSEAKPVIKAETTEEPKGTSSRWTEADEAGRGGSKKTVKETTEPEEKKEKVKKETHFRKGTWNTIKRIAKVPNRLRRTVGRTLMAPTYYLADIGEKKKTGGEDLAKGYKDIWTGKKAA